MGQELDLLRMLEPTVRPVGPGSAGTARPGQQPFEGRSFEDLLAEATQETNDPASATTPPAETPERKPDPLARLAGLDAVENGSLLQVLGRSGTRGDILADDA